MWVGGGVWGAEGEGGEGMGMGSVCQNFFFQSDKNINKVACQQQKTNRIICDKDSYRKKLNMILDDV